MSPGLYAHHDRLATHCSLAATELMCMITGLRRPAKHLEYRGNRGLVFEPVTAAPGQCPYCSQWASRPAPGAADRR